MKITRMYSLYVELTVTKMQLWVAKMTHLINDIPLTFFVLFFRPNRKNPEIRNA